MNCALNLALDASYDKFLSDIMVITMAIEADIDNAICNRVQEIPNGGTVAIDEDDWDALTVGTYERLVRIREILDKISQMI
jgi:hypothetical protein